MLLKNHGDVILDDIREYIDLSLSVDLRRRVWGGGGVTVVAVVAMALASFVLIVSLLRAQYSDQDERVLVNLNQAIYDLKSKLPEEPSRLENPEQAARPMHTYKNRIGMEMVWCWPGTFANGELPQRTRARFQ